MVICNNVQTAINNNDYGFDENYFKNALNTLNTSTSLPDNIKTKLANDLIASDNKILEYIGILITRDMSLAMQVDLPVPNEVTNFKVPIIKDNHHDFSVEPTRCFPKITQCLADPQPPYKIIDANISFQEIKDLYNIHDIDIYNLDEIDYYIEDTNSTIIKNKINLSGKFIKMNLIANVLDSAGCKFCCDPHNYNSILLELELYILNLGFIFYQSYFIKLNNSEYYIYFMISLMNTDNKESFCENKNFKLNLYTYKKNNPGANNLKQKEFILSNNRNFSVQNVCKTLKSATLTGLAKELNDYFNNEFATDINPGIRNEILTTIYISGKGFGDFGQVFSVSCLYYYDCVFKGNCILTTIDTFLFIIAILLGCPIIIGTPKFGYISIDDFLKYKEKSIIEAHNLYNNPKIYKAEPNPNEYLYDSQKLITDLNTEIRKINKTNIDEYTITKIGNNIMGEFIGMALFPKKVSEDFVFTAPAALGVFGLPAAPTAPAAQAAPAARGVSAFQGLQESSDIQGVSGTPAAPAALGVFGLPAARGVSAFQGLEESSDIQGVSTTSSVPNMKKKKES